MGYRVTADVGGTFTDVVVVDDGTAELAVGRTTGRGRVFIGVRNSVECASATWAASGAELVAGWPLFVYSMTLATNAVIERKTRAALPTTEGFPICWCYARAAGRTHSTSTSPTRAIRRRAVHGRDPGENRRRRRRRS